MTDQSKGLRFDLYERIHLPDEVAAIDELEEIELTPRIQVVEQGDHAVLKGQLLLNGVYRGQSDGGSLQTLEHWIPVEITLPLNRVSRLDDISVEIDNFDVDLLSSRTLNVTGVLSLRGILVEPLPDAEEAWREEPITVVHEREASSDDFEAEAESQADAIAEAQGNDTWHSVTQQPYFTGFAGQLPGAQRAQEESSEEEEEEEIEAYEEFEQEEEEENEVDEADASVTISASPRDSGWSASQWFQSSQPVNQPVNQPNANSFQPNPQAFQPSAPPQAPPPSQRENTYAAEQESKDEDWQDESFAEQAEPSQEAFVSFGGESASEAEWQQIQSESPRAPDNDKQEIRIGVGSKQPETSPEQAPNVGLLTLLQTSKREQAARQAAEEVAAKQAEQAKTRSSGDEIEWKTLFLGKQSDENEFRKIRVCIVQRDETLESIAVRYSLNPREILLYNGLNESSVAEGQLLYIP
ncbi:LysM peptidoglycan-binding domain-containing protein [Paenibacillus glycanilyticus]|uniref:LysM peptidoglycan-binding domain-containing protein n=1 Tax=Paenibacillus glycanilyticus TaxID=126569 RepID=UPI002040C904|nr:LysM peptidoglycan-binding domain-containing protein [Paenibacillus glycanilyticus]MCM3630078.1 LysM peptidoglycan-binding domain-containing protein [Paenibacillus glycanilyticus]